MYFESRDKFNIINRKYIYFLIIAITPTLVIGPAIPDIIVSYLAFICIIHLCLNKINIFKNKLIILFFLFYLILLLSSFLSDYYQFSFRSSSVYFRFILFSVLVFLVYEKYPKIIYWCSIVAFITILIVVFDAIFQYIFSYNTIGYERAHATRVSGFFYDKYVLGSFIVRIMPISLIFLFFNNNQYNNLKYKSLILLYFIIIALGIFLSGERTAIVYFLIILILSFLFLNYLRKFFISFFIIFISLSISIFYYDEDIKSRFLNTTISELGLNDNTLSIKIFSDTHQKFYYTSFLIFKDNVFFGAGPNTYRKKCKDKIYKFTDTDENKIINTCATHPHNTYMQLLAEAGIISFLIIIFLFILILYKLINLLINSSSSRNNDIIQFLLLVACFVTLFPFVPNGNFFNNWLNILYFLPVGFLLKKI